MLKTTLRPLGAFIAIVFVYYLLFIFGAEVWDAGWSFGPRLLVPVMGIAMIPIAFALNDLSEKTVLSALSLGAVAWGVLYYQIVHLVFPELPVSATNPILDVIIPALRQGVLSPNRAAILTGTPGLWTLIPAITAVAVVLWQVVGREHTQQLPKYRLRRAALIFAVIGSIGAASYFAGPTWRPKQSVKFTTWMAKMEREQFKDNRSDD